MEGQIESAVVLCHLLLHHDFAVDGVCASWDWWDRQFAFLFTARIMTVKDA